MPRRANVLGSSLSWTYFFQWEISSLKQKLTANYLSAYRLSAYVSIYLGIVFF